MLIQKIILEILFTDGWMADNHDQQDKCWTASSSSGSSLVFWAEISVMVSV